MKQVNIEGKKFGKLQVVKISHKNAQGVFWECICDCGVKTVVRATLLRSGKTKSCGCFSKTDLNGKKFGKLTVLRSTDKRNNGHVLWECKCDCGNIVEVQSCNLSGGRTISCGCSTISKDLSKRRFGMLLAKRPLDERNYRYVVWECDCDCGKTVNVKSGSLLSGATRSCGCRNSRNRLGVENPLWKGFGDISGKTWSGIRRSASVRKLSFKIGIKKAWNLFLKQDRKCAISGMDLQMDEVENRTASLDRIDSSKGYISSNVQWIHKDINQMKHCFDQDYFISMCQKIFENNS